MGGKLPIRDQWKKLQVWERFSFTVAWKHHKFDEQPEKIFNQGDLNWVKGVKDEKVPRVGKIKEKMFLIWW